MNKEKEIQVVTLMINRHCQGKHKTKKNQLCAECLELLDYVKLRLEKCPHKEDKPFCSNCQIHCYKKDMREKIRNVMRYSGPRIMFRHPILCINHLIESKKQKKKLK